MTGKEQTMWNKKRIVWFVLMIITMAVIFYFSGQTGEKSTAVGNTVAQTMNIPKTNSWIDESHTKLLFGLNLRKWAHVGLFGLLGLTASSWILSFPKAFLICLIYSVLDEVHQYFVPGREAKGMDVVIDVIGFTIVIGVLVAARTLQKKVAGNRI